MPRQMTGGQLFGNTPVFDPEKSKTAGELFGNDTVVDGAISNDPVQVDPKKPNYRKMYQDILTGEKDWDTFIPQEKRVAAQQLGNESYDENGKRTLNSAYFADILDMDIDSAYSNHDIIAQELLGESEPVTAFGRIQARFSNGVKQTKVMDLGYEMLTGDGSKDEELLEQIKKIQGSLTQDDLKDLRNFGEKVLGATAEQFPNMWEATKASPWGAIPGGIIGAITALGLGQLGGAGATYEEVVTVPALTMKGIKWGGGTAAANRIRQMEAGGMYIELLEFEDPTGQKIEPQIAKIVAHTVGVINGGLEMAEWGILLSTFGIGSKAFEKITSKVTNSLIVKKGLKNLALKYSLKYGATLTAEVAQELAQESNNIILGELAKWLNNEKKGTDFQPITGEEIADRLGEVTKESFMSFGLLVAPGTVISGAKEAAGQAKAKGKQVTPPHQQGAGDRQQVKGLTDITAPVAPVTPQQTKTEVPTDEEFTTEEVTHPDGEVAARTYEVVVNGVKVVGRIPLKKTLEDGTVVENTLEDAKQEGQWSTQTTVTEGLAEKTSEVRHTTFEEAIQATQQEKVSMEAKAEEVKTKNEVADIQTMGYSKEQAQNMTPERRAEAIAVRDQEVDIAIDEINRRAKEDGVDVGNIEKVDEEKSLDWNNPDHRAGLEAHGITEQEFNDAKAKGIKFVATSEHYSYADKEGGPQRSGVRLFRGHTASDAFHEYAHAAERQGKRAKGFKGTSEEFAKSVADVLTGNSDVAISELIDSNDTTGLDQMSNLGDGTQFNIRTRDGTEIDLPYEVRRAQETKRNPKVIENWEQVYSQAKKLPPGKIIDIKEGGKLGDVVVLHLTRNCQRVNFLKIMKRLGIIPKSVREVSCYAGKVGAGACYKDRTTYSKRTAKWGAKVVGEHSVAEKNIELATRDGIRKMLENPDNRKAIEESEFVRLGQAGDDSHAIYNGLAKDLLEMTKEMGYKMKGKFVFVTSAYAPTTIEHYNALKPYRDMFVIHVTESGYFSYQEVLNRFSEFVMASNAGLNAKMRVITNKDLITASEDKGDIFGAGPMLTEEEKFLFQIIKENDLNNIVLETPFHNDYFKSRSEETGEYKQVCCETGLCSSCGAKCLTRQSKKKNVKIDKLQMGVPEFNIRPVEDGNKDADVDSVRDRKEDEQAEQKLFDEDTVAEEITTEEQTALEQLEEEIDDDLDEEIEPNLYIGNVTQRMKKATATGTGEISGFKEGAFPTKRTAIKMTRRKAMKYLAWLKNDLLRRLEGNEINNNPDLAKANADWGDITALQDALGMPKGKRPFSVVRAEKHTMKQIEDAKKRIYEAIRPTEDAKMTVGQVLSATMKKAAQAARRAFVVGGREARAKAKAHYLEIKQREKERRALKKRIEKAVKVIKKPAPSTVDFFYREAIAQIQAAIDPSVRQGKTKAKRQKMRDFLATATEEQKRDFPKKLARILDAKDLSEFTVEELEQVAEDIKNLIHLGKTKQRARKNIEQAQHDKNVTKMVGVAGGIKGKASDPKGIDFSPEGFKAGVRNAYLWTLRIPRIADWLDGHKGDFGGIWHRFFYDSVNEMENAKLKAIDARHQAGADKMNELGISADELAQTDDLSSLQEGLSLTNEQKMGIYAALKNREAKDAIVNGNKISLKVAEAIVGNLDQKFKDMADFIIEEYASHYDELRQIFIRATGNDMGQEAFYTAMVRLEKSENATNAEIVDQLKQRLNLKKGYVNKDMTIDRKIVSAEHQTPIDIRLVSVWQSQVAKGEHFVHFTILVKQLRKILADKKIKMLLKEKMGSQGKAILDNYVSRIANPSVYKAYDGLAGVSRRLRRNTAMAYLAYNLMTMAKQVPSLILYMADAGPAALISSMVEVMTNGKEVWERVRSMDPQIANATVERELQDIRELAKQTGDANTVQKIDRLIAKVGDKGMTGIRFLDGVVRTIGWNAVYQKNKQLGLSDAESARMAQNATLRTQPASSPKDIAQLYATNEYINWFTMFTNQLNNVWNITTYDTYAYWSSAKYQESAMTMMAVSANAMFIWMLANKALPDDDEDLLDMATDTFINMIPLLNSGAMAGKRGWGSVSPPPFTAAQEIGRMLSAKDKTKQAMKALEASLVLTGVPIVGAKRVGKTLKTGNPAELLGGGKKKRSGAKL